MLAAGTGHTQSQLEGQGANRSGCDAEGKQSHRQTYNPGETCWGGQTCWGQAWAAALEPQDELERAGAQSACPTARPQS